MNVFSQSLVKETIKKNLDVNLSLDMSGGVRSRRGLQHMMFLKFSEKHQQTYLETVMSHALRAEKLSPLGGVEFLKMFCDLQTSVTSRITRKKDAIDLIKSRKYDSSLESLLLECLNLCNIRTRLVLKKSSNEKTFIEITEGHTFDVNSLLKTDTLELKNVRVACIDGYVENISEIHHLLTSLSENKVPCLLFVRGLSDDVLHTIKINNERKTLLVYPFVVPFDLDSVNTIVDIAVISNTDIVSSLKGELMSSLTYDKLGAVQSCTIKVGSVSIKSESSVRTKNHIEALKKNIEEKQEVSEILSKRLRSLSTSCIEISIPDDMNFYSKSQQLDEGIRIIASIVNNTYDPVSAASIIYEAYKKNLTNAEVFYFD